MAPNAIAHRTHTHTHSPTHVCKIRFPPGLREKQFVPNIGVRARALQISRPPFHRARERRVRARVHRITHRVAYVRVPCASASAMRYGNMPMPDNVDISASTLPPARVRKCIIELLPMFRRRRRRIGWRFGGTATPGNNMLSGIRGVCACMCTISARPAWRSAG